MGGGRLHKEERRKSSPRREEVLARRPSSPRREEGRSSRHSSLVSRSSQVMFGGTVWVVEVMRK